MILDREEAIKEIISGMIVVKTCWYYICESADGESRTYSRKFIDYLRKRYEEAGFNFDIKEIAALDMYNTLLNE